jgi:hypothetical protein
MLLCALGLCAQPGKTRGCNLFAGLPFRFYTLYAKSCYALFRRFWPAVFPGSFRSLSADGEEQKDFKHFPTLISLTSCIRIDFLLIFFSAERLRAKSGKTMVGGAVAGPRNFLLKRGVSANAVGQKDCSPGFA